MQIPTILQILFQLVPPLISHGCGHCKIVLWWKGWQAISKDPPQLKSRKHTVNAKNPQFKVDETSKHPLFRQVSF